MKIKHKDCSYTMGKQKPIIRKSINSDQDNELEKIRNAAQNEQKKQLLEKALKEELEKERHIMYEEYGVAEDNTRVNLTEITKKI